MRVTTWLTCAAMCAGFAVIVPTAPARAAATCDATWIGAAGASWTNASNWSPAAVPTSSTNVCVTTTAGPSVPAPDSAWAANLYVRGSQLNVDATLNVATADVSTSTIAGAGSVTVTGTSTFGVLTLAGQLSLTAQGTVTVNGAGPLCGTTLAVCLTGTSRLVAQIVALAGGSIGGDTTARPAVDVAQRLVVVNGAKATRRIFLSLSVRTVENYTSGAQAAAVQLARWSQLTFDGTLTGVILVPGSGGIIVARPITTFGGAADGSNMGK